MAHILHQGAGSPFKPAKKTLVRRRLMRRMTLSNEDIKNPSRDAPREGEDQVCFS
jgi:hypothetical protein